MVDKPALEKTFKDHGFLDFKWIRGGDIIVSHWVRFRCLYGCPAYGKKGTCPPNVPSIDECRKMISEYGQAAVFHFTKKVESPEDRRAWGKGVAAKLMELEREVFLSGYYKTLLVSFEACGLCDSCTANRAECRNPRLARPGADALGIDVYATVRSIGYPIQVLKNKDEEMNRYAFLLID